ncbi:DUF3575 domain-containing protein [Dyadobacter sp. CY323]|uniref:DUF3575 domain-containing protein n=1 Tax=Dyadobacter sp. CY323 TaxID=2907302 RepID=UPI001F2327C6|nr:DUF3575 domain-containing protein [Dyadobacter sp. CY323]MCE6991043.1 DUF3575 domain-containing protein [Dyadobacter sp. CY323]
MKTISILLSALAFLASVNGFAQGRKYLNDANLDVHIMPIALVFPDPSLRIGAEYMTSGRWSFGLSLGAGTSALSYNTPFSPGNSKRYNMMEIRPEVKFYWLKRNEMGWYAAAEGFVSNANRQLGKNSHYLSDSTQMHFESAHFSKKKTGMVGKIGVKFLIPKRLTIDMYTGLGLARTNVTYSKIENPTEEFYDPFFEVENFYPGKKFTPVVSLGIKFGMLVWQ